MKRTISLFLSAVMVLSCFFGLSFDAFAETLKNMGTINLDETKTIEIDDEDEIAYYNFTPSKTATYMYYSLADDTVDPKGYIYKGEDVIAVNDDGASAGYHNFFISVELTAGVTYKLAGNIYDNETGSYDVTIEENPYKSISVDLAEPIQIIENSDGEWDVDEDGNDYFCYENYSDELYKEGNSITLTKNDDSTVVYTYDWDEYAFVNSEGDRLDFYCSSDQYGNHWALGENNYFTLGAFGFTEQVPVEIIKNPYKSISVTLAEPIQIIENTDGYWDVDEDGNDYYEYDYSLYREGNTITLTKNDDSTVVYTYDEYECEFVNSEGDRLDFYCYDDQEENHWTLGKNNYITVEAFDLTTQVPVEIIQNPYKSISVTLAEPIQIFENADGDWEEDENGNDFFCYDIPSIHRDGNSITVTKKDNTTDVYNYNWDSGSFINSKGEELDEEYYSTQYENHWTLGKNNYFTVEVLGLTADVPVEIIQNPYKSISVTLAKPIQLVENYDGEWDVDDDDNDFFIYYGYGIYREGNSITVTMKDNTKVVYTYDEDEDEFVNSKGEVLDFDYNSNQYSKHWTRGKNNYFTVEAFGCTTQVPVEIIENPVASISFVLGSPIQLIENVDGDWEEDENGDKYFCYDYSFYKEGNKLIIKYKNGKTETCPFVKSVYGFVNENGEEIYFDYYSNQYSKPWTLGKNNYITVEYMGAETQVPVEIVKNTVKAISFTPAKPIRVMENTFGSTDEDEDGNDYFRYRTNDYVYEKGAALTVTYTDNSTEKFVYNGDDFISQKTNKALEQYVDADADDDQYENHWGVGTNYFTVSCYGKGAQVPVEIYASNITSAEFIPAKPYKLLENTNGYYTYDENGDKYYKYYIPGYNDGDIIRFTLSDGTKADFVFVDDGEYEPYFYSEYFGREWFFGYSHDQYDNHWTVGENPFWIDAFGIEIEATVEIIAEEGHEHTWKEVVVKPTCCDKGYTYKRCEECGAEGEPYNYTDKTAHTYDSGTVLKAATATEEGKILYVCTWCGKTKTVTAPKLTPTTPITLTTPAIKKLKKGKKRFTAFWDKIPGVTRYEIQYSRNKKFKKGKKYGTKIKKVSANKSKITIKKLKKGKRYYVRIRAVKGTQVSPWSKTKKIKVK